jgi:hypothetical protein
MAVTSRDADRLQHPAALPIPLFCGIADDVPPSTASKRSMALNPE